ncbi:MAG: hypothetical protein KDB40_21500 [Acidimicrobiales bacterium]|nr:hypothetical protein [Acidimicrobiales bacterium]MCB9395270.1 hypothetical protein [Acidimicrobiaceae bacterium]
MLGDWLSIVVLGGLSSLIFVSGLGPFTDRMLDRWCLRYDVAVDQHGREWLRTQLRRARAWRWCGFAVGTVVSALPMYANVIDRNRAADFATPANRFAPWLLAAAGSVVGELLSRRPPGGRRAAHLATRHWRDYCSSRWVAVVGWSVPVSVAFAVQATQSRDLGWRWSWLGPAVALCGSAAVTVGLRHLVNRPGAPDGLDRLVDDALRADSAHHLVGASVALAGLGTSHAALALDLGWLGLLVGMGQWLAIAAWWYVARQETWNVARVRWSRS